MKTFVVLAVVVGVISAGRLDSTYLPPGQQNFGAASHGSFSSGFGSASGGFSSSSSSYSGGGAHSFGGAASGAGHQIPITRFNNNNDGAGNYAYDFETGNGISVHEQGSQRKDAVTAEGGYSFTAPDGQQYSVRYVADENGFHAEGSHLPTPPPIPEAILKSLEFNKQEEAKGGYRDGDDGGHQYNQGGNGGGFGGGHHQQGGYKY